MVNGPGLADGQTELLMIVRLVNSDGSKVKGYASAYELISGSAATSACTASNTDGVSTCVLKAIQAGVNRVSLTNIKIQLPLLFMRFNRDS